ncbi:MAG TPA: manganese efflux pump [Thermoanaerobaculia bacterium]|nr:manganese efflux pump [Thermoanaerobaculia bacterium]
MLRLLLLGVLAGIDNLQVAAALSVAPLSRARRVLLALSFTVCETTTPLIGYLLAHSLRVRLGSGFDHAAPFIVIGCGAAIVWLALRERDTAPLVNSGWTIFGLPLSLSLDNLLVGVSLGSFGYRPAVAALAIGGTSAVLCLCGIVFGARVRRLIPQRAELVSGAALIAVAASMWIRS